VSGGIFVRDCAIVGIGETPLGKRPGSTTVELQAEAVLAALADAGISPASVDGLFNLGPYSRPSMMFASTLGEYLGIHPAVQISMDAGGVLSPMLMIANAVASIQSGLCSVAVAVFGEPAATGKPVEGRGWTTTADDIEFEAPFGIVGTVAPYALLANRHAAIYGSRPEHLGAIALSARRHALLNPNAVMRKPLDMETYLASRPIADPLKLLDCSVMVDGAGAVVITSLDRARDLPHAPILLTGAAMRASHRNVGQFPDFPDLGIRALAAQALSRAGVTLKDVDVATIHDAFTISTLVYLEEVGFCERGEGGDYVAEGNIDLGSRCPVNPHGGLLSQGHVGGMLHVVEAVRQLRHGCGERQVPDANVALIAGGGGIMGVNGVFVLGRA
jgi:acetyl-CoA acetyltransferase